MTRPLTSQLRWFIVLAVVIAWGTWIPALVWPRLPKLLPLVGLFAPALAAAFVGGRAGVRDLVARARRWRFPATWYAVAALLMPACYALAVRLEGALSGRDVRGLWIGSPLAFLVASFVWLLVVTSGEEIGWRGFALPRLLALGLSPWSASLVLGVVWALWHLPLYLAPGQSPMPFSLFLALTAGQSLVYTALYLRSGGSLLPAVLLHATTDFGARLYHVDQFGRGPWVLVDLLVACAGIALLRFVAATADGATSTGRDRMSSHVPSYREAARRAGRRGWLAARLDALFLQCIQHGAERDRILLRRFARAFGASPVVDRVLRRRALVTNLVAPALGTGDHAPGASAGCSAVDTSKRSGTCSESSGHGWTSRGECQRNISAPHSS